MDLKIKTIAVDDEPLALDVIKTYCDQIPELELIASCKNAIEANHVLQNEEVDLMFLDIQMPQLTGLEFLKSLNEAPAVIFTTAYSDYAVEGFELNALDYLLKPISIDRFMKSVNKAIDFFQIKQRFQEEEQDIVAESDHMYVKADKKLIKVEFEDIFYIEGLKDYVIIKRDEDRIITLQTMKSLDEKLPSNLFQRIHRSYIANLEHIEAIVGNSVEMVIKGKKVSLPIGKNYKEGLLEIINQTRL